MIRLERYGEVTRVRMSNWRSRLIGYEVSAYVSRGVLVDSGFPLARRALDGVIAALRPDAAMITHWHEDHAGNVPLMAERGIPLAMSPATLAALRGAPPIPGYRRFTWGAPRAIEQPIVAFTHDVMRLVHTPGHSADHHVVWDADRETLFSGDLWLGLHVRLAQPDEDPRTLARSLRAAIALGPREMYDAHRGPVTTPIAALQAKADWLEALIESIDARIAAGWADAAIARALLGGEDWTAVVSRGEYARRNIVASVRRGAVRG
jgi:endoribonuclease LACTB2